MGELAIYVKDFELGTKIAEIAVNFNKEVVFPNSFYSTSIINQDTELVIVDLDEKGDVLTELITNIHQSFPTTPIVGFITNVQKWRHQQAKKAGCSWVFPRSSLIKNLPTLIKKGLKNDE